jgi:hypothetical protein
MKTKKQMTIIVLLTGLLAAGIVYADDPVKGKGNDSTTSGNGMGWQEQTQRTSMMINDGIRISAGPTVGTSGFGLSLSFSSNFSVIECCQPATLKQSWCNYNADDPRCKD